MAEPGPSQPTRYCRHCQYVLDGLTENRCPECGRPFDPAEPSTYLTEPHAPPGFKPWLDCLLSIGCIVLCVILLPRGRRVYLEPAVVFLPSICLVAFGVGFARSGCRRGKGASRLVAVICYLVSLFVTVGMAIGLSSF